MLTSSPLQWGRYDLAISKTEVSPDPFVEITAVSPHFHTSVEINVGGDFSSGTMVALDPAVDEIRFVDVLEGEYIVGNG